MTSEFDEEAVSLARGILEGSIDRIDGLWELGACIYNTRFFTPEEFGVLVAVFDELETVPRQSHRSQWDETAYDRGRARGNEVLARYAEDIEAALPLVLIRAA